MEGSLRVPEGVLERMESLRVPEEVLREVDSQAAVREGPQVGLPQEESPAGFEQKNPRGSTSSHQGWRDE